MRNAERGMPLGQLEEFDYDYDSEHEHEHVCRADWI
jgi:hypothetical protein